jgi:hypothetical protein
MAKKIMIAGKKRVLNARKDTFDIRDRMYEPALVQLLPEIDYYVRYRPGGRVQGCGNPRF